MSYKLTDAELSWLDNVFTQVNEELHETVSKLGVAPLRHHVVGLHRQTPTHFYQHPQTTNSPRLEKHLRAIWF